VDPRPAGRAPPHCPSAAGPAACRSLASLERTFAGESPPAEGEAPPLLYTYDVVNTYPHDTGAFTQGLSVAAPEDRPDGSGPEDVWLHESTGGYGESEVRLTQLVTGEVEVSRSLRASEFGEGLARTGSDPAEVHVVTWRTGVGHRFDARSLTPLGNFDTGRRDGWGLASDPGARELLLTDSGSSVFVLDDASHALKREVKVTDGGVPVRRLNELELIPGSGGEEDGGGGTARRAEATLLSNVWQKDCLAHIHLGTGAVLGWIDLSGLWDGVRLDPGDDVLNGIAYDAPRDRLFVTGKRWPHVYEIRVRRQDAHADPDANEAQLQRVRAKCRP